ncbi:MAG TPA: 2'-5' RNA ligase family protein [Acidimicrobiales bacterium]|nr:2'-5' RNA ligase family protein [Acidimicrobiales bacterium]
MAWAGLEGTGASSRGDDEASGLGPDCSQSAVLVPVPEADALVGEWRALYDPKARTGVPAHITLLFPWIAPHQLKPEHLDELDKILAAQPAFEYSLDRVRWFGQRVLWLAPDPAEPFKRLTVAVATHFDTQPWQGEFAEIVPHLTIGLAGQTPGNALEQAAAEIAMRLPLRCEAREVDVMCAHGTYWQVVHRTELRRT